MPRQRLTATERAEREQKRMLDALRSELRKTLERDAQKLLNDVRQQLTNELQGVFVQATRQSNSGTSNDSFSSVGSLSRIVGNILRLSAKPRTSSISSETARSQDAMNQFRTSRGQTMTDFSNELGKGEKNT
jgi:hypothetical protein